MKMLPILNNELKHQETAYLQQLLLDRAMKVKKISKELKENVHYQKAQDALEQARAPFKKMQTKWTSEILAIELELKARNIKFNITYNDIFEEDSNE